MAVTPPVSASRTHRGQTLLPVDDGPGLGYDNDSYRLGPQAQQQAKSLYRTLHP